MKLAGTEFGKNMRVRVIMFAMMGMGYDVLVTTLQQVLGGHLNIHAIQTASTWMLLVYGTIPFVVYPVQVFLKKIGVQRLGNPLVFLLLFYLAEYLWGTLFHQMGIKAWDYNWYTPLAFNTTNGYVSFHPRIILTWFIFVILAESLDSKLREMTL